MAFDSDHLRFANYFNLRQSLAFGTIIIKPPRADIVRRGDDAEQALAQRIAPGAHGTHIPLARMQPAHRVGVQEADDVAARLFSSKSPPTIRHYTCRSTTAITQTFTPPCPAAVRSDQGP